MAPAPPTAVQALRSSGQSDHRQALVSSDSGRGLPPSSLGWTETDPQDWTWDRQDALAMTRSWLEGRREDHVSEAEGR